MIESYWGEFLISPIPLELSLNACSGGCAYCFATLNSPDRRADLPATMRMLQDFRERTSWAARLLREGYPVLLSNRSDPFSKNNYRLALPLMRVMHDMDIPMTFQTRGGWGVDEALEFLRPACWYVTVETMDDDLGRRLSPGTPPPSARLALVQALVEAGHEVVVGYNPCVPEWQPDPEPLLRAVKAAGAWGVWIETLHLNYRQIGRMRDQARALVGEDLIRRARKRRLHEKDEAAFRAARDCARALGLEVYSNGQPNRSSFWQPWEAMYPKLFPTTQGFVNWCHDECERDDVLAFDWFADLLLPDLPAGEGPLDSYLGSTSRQLWRTHQIPTTMTFAQLLGIGWVEPRVKFCPARLPAFAYAGAEEAEEEGWTQFVDGRGLPYLVFSGGEEWMFWHREVG